MFTVRCIRRVGKAFAVTSGDVWLYRDVQLPCAPYPGLILRGGDWEFAVTEVCYEASEGIFACYTRPDEPRIGEERSVEEMADIVDRYTSAGWQKLVTA